MCSSSRNKIISIKLDILLKVEEVLGSCVCQKDTFRKFPEESSSYINLPTATDSVNNIPTKKTNGFSGFSPFPSIHAFNSSCNIK